MAHNPLHKAENFFLQTGKKLIKAIPSLDDLDRFYERARKSQERVQARAQKAFTPPKVASPRITQGPSIQDFGPVTRAVVRRAPQVAQSALRLGQRALRVGEAFTQAGADVVLPPETLAFIGSKISGRPQQQEEVLRVLEGTRIKPTGRLERTASILGTGTGALSLFRALGAGRTALTQSPQFLRIAPRISPRVRAVGKTAFEFGRLGAALPAETLSERAKEAALSSLLGVTFGGAGLVGRRIPLVTRIPGRIPTGGVGRIPLVGRSLARAGRITGLTPEASRILAQRGGILAAGEAGIRSLETGTQEKRLPTPEELALGVGTSLLFVGASTPVGKRGLSRLLTRQESILKRIESLESQGKEIPESLSKQFDTVAKRIASFRQRPRKELIKVKVPEIPKELEPLAEEARKYKSAEEFVSNMRRSIAWRNAERIAKSDFQELRLRKFGDQFVVVNEQGQTLAPATSRQTAEQAGTAAARLKQLGVNNLTDFYNQAVKGVRAKVKPVIPKELKPTREELEAYEDYEREQLAQIAEEVKRDKYGTYLGDFNAHVRVVRLQGERQPKRLVDRFGKEGTELYRERIPRDPQNRYAGSEEIAEALGMDHRKYMEEVVEAAGLTQGSTRRVAGIIHSPKTSFGRSVVRKAKIRASRGEIPIVPGQASVLQKAGIAVRAEPTATTLRQIRLRQVAPEIKREREFLRSLEGFEPRGRKLRPFKPVLQKVVTLAREIRANTAEAIRKNQATPEQVQAIRQRRDELQIKNSDLNAVIEGIAGDRTLQKLTKSQAEQVLKFLSPKNWDEIEQVVFAERQALLAETAEEVGKLSFKAPPEFVELEQRFGRMGTLNQALLDADRVAENFGREAVKLAEAKPIEGLRAFFGGLSSSFGPPGATTNILGFRREIFAPYRSMLNFATNLGKRWERSNKAIFTHIRTNYPEEWEQFLNIVNGVKGAKKGANPEILKLAKYFRETNRGYLQLINKLRKIAGAKPIPEKKNYGVPYIVANFIADALRTTTRWDPSKMRSVTPKEFAETTFFTKDPERLAEEWGRYTEYWFRMGLYKAYVAPMRDFVAKRGETALKAFDEMIEADIYNKGILTGQLKAFFAGTKSLVDRISTFIPQNKVEINTQTLRLLENSSLAKDVDLGKIVVKEGNKIFLKVPKFRIPNIASEIALPLIYAKALAWNVSFGIINLTQPIAAIPFVGTRTLFSAYLDSVRLLNPFDLTKAKNWARILDEAGYEYGKIVGGEEQQFTHRAINLIGDVTEFINRTTTAIAGEKFLHRIEKEAGRELSVQDRERIMTSFSTFINFLYGKGFSPRAQRGSFGKLFYVFVQYPLNQLLEVYPAMARTAMQDQGARRFWETMTLEGGASPEAMRIFESLSPSSKAQVFRIATAVLLPTAIIYKLSDSLNVAERALPGVPRFGTGVEGTVKLFAAIGNYIENPARGEELKLAWNDFLEEPYETVEGAITSRISTLNKLAKAMELRQTGLLETQRGTPISAPSDATTVARVAVFGQSVLPEYEQAFPGTLARILGKGDIADDITVSNIRVEHERERVRKSALRLIKQARKAESTEEVDALIAEARKKNDPEVFEKIMEKVPEILEEEQEGIQTLDRRLKGLRSDQRARVIVREALRLDSPEAVDALIRDLRAKGLYTDEVDKHIPKMIQEETNKQNLLEKVFDFLIKKVRGAEAPLTEQPIGGPTLLSEEQIKLLEETLFGKGAKETIRKVRVGKGKSTRIPASLIQAAGRFPKFRIPQPRKQRGLDTTKLRVRPFKTPRINLSQQALPKANLTKLRLTPREEESLQALSRISI